jgi:hypothetical protein
LTWVRLPRDPFADTHCPGRPHSPGFLQPRPVRPVTAGTSIRAPQYNLMFVSICSSEPPFGGGPKNGEQLNPEGVADHSPGSPEAHPGSAGARPRFLPSLLVPTPTGSHPGPHRTRWDPEPPGFGRLARGLPLPGVCYATPGCFVRRLRRREDVRCIKARNAHRA